MQTALDLFSLVMHLLPSPYSQQSIPWTITNRALTNVYQKSNYTDPTIEYRISKRNWKRFLNDKVSGLRPHLLLVCVLPAAFPRSSYAPGWETYTFSAHWSHYDEYPIWSGWEPPVLEIFDSSVSYTGRPLVKAAYPGANISIRRGRNDLSSSNRRRCLQHTQGIVSHSVTTVCIFRACALRVTDSRGVGIGESVVQTRRKAPGFMAPMVRERFAPSLTFCVMPSYWFLLCMDSRSLLSLDYSYRISEPSCICISAYELWDRAVLALVLPAPWGVHPVGVYSRFDIHTLHAMDVWTIWNTKGQRQNITSFFWSCTCLVIVDRP